VVFASKDPEPVWDLSRVGEVADRVFAPVAVIAADGTLLYVNAAAARAVHAEPAWLIGRNMLELVHPDDRCRVSRQLAKVAKGRPPGGLTTYRLRADPAREWRVFESIASNLLDDPGISGIMLSSRDLTDQRAHEQALYAAAYTDPLTDLPNRARVARDLDELMQRDAPIAVALLGIDRFSLINDSLGHATGDAVLKVMATRVASAAPDSTVVGRFGSDVFALLISGPAAAEARSLAWRIIEWAGEPLFVDRGELRLAMSAGITHRDAAATSESLLRDAGSALRRAKENGGGRVEPFELALRDAATARLELEADLRRAIAGSEFNLALQPIVRLDRVIPVRAEALVRWHHGDCAIAPERFIPIAEETGLIVPLGDWIIDRAVQLAPIAPGGRISINLSPRQLASPGLADRIAQVLETRGLAPAAVSFEVTETWLVEHFDYSVEVLNRIRKLGCRVGLDDFGTGYSSLAYLRRLPIDFLKVDGSLTADIDTDHQARAIVGAIIAMADALGLEVVAEGVETPAQATVLRDVGCPLAQGYLFGRPVIMG
jgi:diguanylate cyclase (GGDEF)-like protein/PAS domain S-box-containing protein